MQAHVLQVPEAHGVRIEKAIVDVESQNAALVLADSSCLLVSLTTSSSSVAAAASVTPPVAIPAPCTDACFLRLRTSIKAIHMQSVIAGRSNNNLHNNQTLTHRRLAAVAQSKLYMLTTQPGLDGTSMEFRSWSCDARAFSPVTVDVGLEQGFGTTTTGRVAAGRFEAPYYGLDVKIGASINVVVVYSSSAGKIWIMAAKSASGKGYGSQAEGATVSSEGEGTARADDREAEGGASGRLLLLNSVVLDCNRPVFSLHVSPQHLLLGENNGVRVWFLRPLIKPSKMERDKAYQVKLIKPKPRVHEEAGGFVVKRALQNGFKWEVKLQNGGHPRANAVEVESAAAIGDGSTKEAKMKDEDMQENPSEEGGGNFLEKERINGIVQSNSVGGRGYIPAPFPGDLERDLKCSVDSQGDAVSNDDFVLFHLQGTGGSNGLVPVVGASVKWQEPVFHQPTPKVSPTETTPVPCPNNVLLLNGKGGTAMKKVGLAGPLFVRINEDDDIESSVSKRRSQGAPPPTQVVDIQALNLKKFVLLDSRGTLNLLMLQEPPEAQEPGTLNRFQLFTKHLPSLICVSSMAVLPLPPASVSTGPPLGRKLWISDGKYSIHVVILSEDGTPAANVTQAVFTNERIKGLFAGSARTVMVLMEGGMVVYVEAGV